MTSQNSSSNSRRSKKKSQATTPTGKKLSGKSSDNFLNLKKQVELVNQKAVKEIERIASDPDITWIEFYRQIRKVGMAFKIMDAAIQLGEGMKKLKEDK